MAMPVGTSTVSPEETINSESIQARISIPAEPSVAICGRGIDSPILGSNIFSSMDLKTFTYD